MPGSALELYEDFINETAEGHPEGKADFRCSASGKCIRLQGYMLKGLVKEPTGSFVKRAAHKGHLLHKDLQSALAKKGVLVAAEKYRRKKYRYRGVEFTVGGHLDALVNLEGDMVIVEAKSRRSFIFKQIQDDGPPFEMLAQTNMYIDMWKADHGELIVENRDTGELIEHWVSPDPTLMKQLLKRFYLIKKLFLKGKIPKRPFPKDSRQCRYCPYFSRCWKEAPPRFHSRKGKPEKKLKASQRNRNLFIEMMRMYAKYRQLRVESEQTHAALKTMSQQLLDKFSTDCLVCDDRIVKRTVVTTQRPDKSVIDELVEAGTIPVLPSEYYRYDWKDRAEENE